MSKITNDSLTRSGTGCFIWHLATVGVKGFCNSGETEISVVKTVGAVNQVIQYIPQNSHHTLLIFFENFQFSAALENIAQNV